jgi:hypothetical protein
MNIALWALQGILAIKCLSAAVTHLRRPGSAELQSGALRLGAAARPLLLASAAGLLLGAAGLLLPGALRTAPWLTPLAAALLALWLAAGALLHRRCRQRPHLAVGLLLVALAAAVALGRWLLVPL